MKLNKFLKIIYGENLINKIINADCIKLMKRMSSNFVDSCITDSPYSLGFMGKEWDIKKDFQKWTTLWATELFRILKPGAYLLAFGGTRTEHRLTSGIEDSGFIIRDKICWFNGQGFPKSKDVSKGFDKQVGVKRKKTFRPIAYPDSGCWGIPNSSGDDIKTYGNVYGERGSVKSIPGMIRTSLPVTPLAKQWSGWGTALKPAFEFIVLAQKPLDKNYCHNLEKWGCGAMNIDEGRIGIDLNDQNQRKPSVSYNSKGSIFKGTGKRDCENLNPQGRWPANLILECICEGKRHTDPNCPCWLLDKESGKLSGPWGKDGAGCLKGKSSMFGFGGINSQNKLRGKELGGASRFFKYIPKVNRKEKEAGLRGRIRCVKCGKLNSKTHINNKGQKVKCIRNDHPTVKPIKLFQYLQKLFTPLNGLTIDPFAGSGTSCIAAKNNNLNFIAIDQSRDYCKIAKARNKNLFKLIKFK